MLCLGVHFFDLIMFGFNEPFEFEGLCLFAKLRKFSAISISDTFSSLWSFWNYPTLIFQSLGQKVGALQGLCLPPGPKGGRADGDKKGFPTLKTAALIRVQSFISCRFPSLLLLLSQLLGFEAGTRKWKGRKNRQFLLLFLTIGCFLPHFLTTGLLEISLSSPDAHSRVSDFD